MHHTIWNKHRGWCKGLALLLTVVLCLQLLCTQALAAQSGGSWYATISHPPVTAADLTYQGYDSTAFTQAVQELQNAYQKTGQSKRITRLIQTILDEYDKAETQLTLAQVAYYQNVRDRAMVDAVQALSILTLQMRDQAFQVLSQGFATDYADILAEQVGWVYAEAVANYDSADDSLFALTTQEQQLVQQYEALYKSDYAVTVKGKTWTKAQYEANPPKDAALSEQVQLALVQKLNSLVGPIYQQLVQVRTQIAQQSGYESYAEYAYLAYGRDYTTADSRALQQVVKQSIVPLYQRLATVLQDADLSALKAINQKGDVILEKIAPYLQQIDPELGAAFQLLQQFGLYDVTDRPNKMDLSFTVPLPAYHNAYLFVKPTGTVQDYNAIVHEFGHYAAMCHEHWPALLCGGSLDVQETQSQGLEAVFSVFAADLFGEQADLYQLWTVYNLLGAVVDGCCQDELQTLVYANPNMTLQEINQAYYKIAKSYGYAMRDGVDEAYSWVQIPHNFQSPCYYISYSTSALSALDLYLQACKNPEQAADRYMRLSGMDSLATYGAAVDYCGLRDVFASGTVASIAKELSQTLQVDRKRPSLIQTEVQQLNQSALPIMPQRLFYIK